MKRFYKTAAAAETGHGFTVLLDGRPVLTPARQPLDVTKPLAEAIAAEWQGQGGTVVPGSMPMMQLAATAIDHVPAKRGEFSARLLAYVDGDSLCLRDEPGVLRHAQNAHWQPPLDWLKKIHGIALDVGTGIKAPSQPADAHQALKSLVDGLDAFAFIGVLETASVTGSLVLALALREKALTAEQVFCAAELESLYQAKRWGEDAEATVRLAAIQEDVNVLARWFALLSA